jgi:exportin-T
MEDDIQIQKHSIGSLSKMIELWAVSPPSTPSTSAAVNGTHGLAGFNQFILEQILPLCFRIPFKPTFNLMDGQSYLILGELCGIKRLMLHKLGPDFLQYLQTTYLPSVGVTPQTAAEYLQALQSPDPKAFTKYFKVLLQSKKV